MLQFFLGFIVGGLFGFGVCAVCSINKDKSDHYEFNTHVEKPGDSDATK